MSFREWEVYAVCPCGWYHRAPFGSKFHVHKEVCPQCGESKDTWKVQTMRWVKDGWFKGHWEIKE